MSSKYLINILAYKQRVLLLKLLNRVKASLREFVRTRGNLSLENLRFKITLAKALQ